MADNYFVQNYAIPVEEEPLAAAPPPQQPAPEQAPPPQQSSGNYFQDAYVAPPPDNYQPGSTYVPPQDRGLTTVPPPPPPPPPGGVEGFVQSVQEAPTPLDKLGAVVGLYDAPNQESQRRLGEAAIARDGAPADTGSYSLTNPEGWRKAGERLGNEIQDYRQHPEHLAQDVAFGLAADSANQAFFGEPGFNDWANANPDKRDAYRDNPDGLYQEYLNDIGYTLESGGILGLGKGLVQQSLTDPLTVATAGLSGVGGLAARGAATAGKTGLARGIVTAEHAGQAVLDPIGEVAGRAVSGIAPNIPGLGKLFQPSAATQQTQATDIVQEVTQGTAREARGLRTVPPVATTTPSVTPNPTPTVTPPTNGAVPNGTAPIPPIAPTPATSPVGTNGAVPTPANGVGAPPTQPSNPFATQARTPTQNGSIPALMRGRTGWTLVDGTRPTRGTLRQSYKVIEKADPDELRPFRGGQIVNPDEQTKLSAHLAAMTEQRLVLDDWPSSRPATNYLQREKKQAGQAWIKLFSKRIETFGKREVDRLVDAYNNDVGRVRAQGPMAHETSPTYFDDRAASIMEAARKAKYDEPFSLQSPSTSTPYTYRPKNAAPETPIVAVDNAPTPMPMDEAAFQTFQAIPEAQRPALRSKIIDLMNDPDGMSAGSKHRGVRQQLYIKGVWSKTMPSATRANTPGGQAQQAAYDRYQAFLNAFDAAHGNGLSRARRGPSIVQIYGSLAPQQRAIADAVATEFRAHLDAMGLGHVRLGLVDHIRTFEGGAQKQLDWFADFNPEFQNIDISVNYTMNNVLYDLDGRLGPDWALRVSDEEVGELVKQSLYQSLNHETVHALRSMGVFTPDEWNLLVNEAHMKGYGQWAANNYDDLSFPMQDEEAVAELFGDFARDQLLNPQTRSILQKIVDFFTGFVRATKHHDAQGVMKSMLDGSLAGRGSPYDPLPAELMPQARRGKSIDVLSKPTDYDGLMIPENWKAVLRNTIPFKGQPDVDLYTALKGTGNDVEHLRFLAAQHHQTPLTGQDLTDFNALKKQFDGYEPRYDWADPKFDADEVERIAATHVTQEWVKKNYPNANKPPAPGVTNKLLQINADVMGFRRAMGLTNLVAWPRQLVVQTLGNVVGFGIARPDAITEMFRPNAYIKSIKASRDPKVLTHAESFWKDMGFAPNSNAALNTGVKALSRNATTSNSPFLNAIRKFLAPDWAGNIVAASDDVARGALGMKAYIPGMKRVQSELPQKATDTWKAYAAKRAMPAVDPREISKVIADTLKNTKPRGRPISGATGQDLEKALLNAFSNRPGGDIKNLRDFADRVGRDYNEQRNLWRQAAGKETNRVLFSWDDTNLDAFLKHIALYHYWASRASGLYLKEAIKKPIMGASFVRLGQALQAEAEENGYPNWLKGFTRVVNSPAGVTLMMSPADLLGTMVMFADWQWGSEPAGAANDMNLLATAYGTLPLFFGPLVNWGAYLTGVDPRVPYNTTGLEPMFSRAAQVINLANVNGHLPPGMLRDANGNPTLISPQTIQNALQNLAVAFAGKEPLDLDAGFKNRTLFYLQGVLRKDHPEWVNDPTGSDQLIAMQNEMQEAAMMGNPSPEWLQAEQMAVQESLTGPEFPGLPGALIRVLSPVRMTSMPETKAEQMYGFGNVGSTPAVVGTEDTYDGMDLKGRPYDTLDMALLNAANEEWFAVGTDTGLRDAVTTYNAIGKGTLNALANGGTVTIRGTAYNSESLPESKSERYKLAEQWLNDQGYTVADKDAYYSARDDIKNAHPDLAGYQEFRDYAMSYPGGIKGFTDAAMLSSPSFAAFMNELPYPPGSDDWYGMADNAEAYYALEGKRASIYDPTTMPDKGTIPGLAYGENFIHLSAVNDAIDEASRSEGGTGFDAFVSEIDGNVSNLYHAQRIWNETFPGWPLRVGMDFIDNSGGAYDYIKEQWKAAGVYPPEKGDIAYEYYWEWLPANATASDHSVRAFLSQREDGGGSVAESEPVTPDMIASQLGITLQTAQPGKRTDGKLDTSGMQKVVALNDVEMRTGPSLNNPMNVIAFSGQPMWVSDIEGEWAQVVGLGDEVGWVPTASLKRAA